MIPMISAMMMENWSMNRLYWTSIPWAYTASNQIISSGL